MYINKKILKNELKNIKKDGLYKEERAIESEQQSVIKVNQNKVLNFCANNYLGLSNNVEIINSAKEGLEKWGFGLSSVRFICGTQTIHTKLERKISNFLIIITLIFYFL